MRIVLSAFFLLQLLLSPCLAQSSNVVLGYKLRDAVAAGDLATTTRLLNEGLDVNHDMGGGSTALHMAAALGRLEIAKYLLSKGADPGLRDSFGRTPVDLARNMNHLETVQYLDAVAKAAAPSPAQTPSSGVPLNASSSSPGASSPVTNPQAAESTSDGVALFYSGRYQEAARAFQQEALRDPNDPNPFHWHGLALVGLNKSPSDVWLKAPITNDRLSLTQFLTGLDYWRQGNVKLAEYYFRGTQKYPNSLGQTLADRAMRALANSSQAPPLNSWPALVQLPGAKGDTSTSAVSAQPRQPAADRPQQVANNAAGGAIPAGVYQGYDTFVSVGSRDVTTYKEKLAILGDGRYERRYGNSVPGTFAYDPGTGVITFTSGPYAQDGVTARFGRRGDGKPMITITYTFDKLGSDEDFFVLVSP